jgi:hypothetical protein
VKSILPILLLGLAGLFVGGALSLRRQGSGPAPVVVMGVLAAAAAVAGVLWLVPES